MTPVPTRPPRILNAQGEQRDCAHTHEQNHQCHRIVVEPMLALFPRLPATGANGVPRPLILGSEKGRRDNSSELPRVPSVDKEIKKSTTSQMRYAGGWRRGRKGPSLS